MYFKIIDKDSPAFTSLSAYMERFDAAKATCDAFAERNGSGNYGWGGFLMIGVQAIEANNPPAGWRPCPEFGTNWWTFDLRTKAGKKLHEEASNLPRLTVYDVVNALAYDYNQCLGRSEGGGCIKAKPTVCRTHDGDGFLFSVPDMAKYTPMEGMVEITKTEALKLQGGEEKA
jgi:hypothetical protein